VTRRKAVKVRLNQRFIRFDTARFFFRPGMTSSLLINAMAEKKAENDKCALTPFIQNVGT
jgi:hypothetical protein